MHEHVRHGEYQTDGEDDRQNELGDDLLQVDIYKAGLVELRRVEGRTKWIRIRKGVAGLENEMLKFKSEKCSPLPTSLANSIR